MTIGDEKVVAEVCEDQSGSKYLCWSPGLTPLPPAGTRLYTAPPSAPVGVEVNGRAPTHYCRVCGALWADFGESWSLVSAACGKCCDNVPMGEQIAPLALLTATAAEIRAVKRARDFLARSDASEAEGDAFAGGWSECEAYVAQQPAADEEYAEQFRRGWEAGHAAAQQPAAIPRLANCGKYTATDNNGQHYYLNHANTWQTFQGQQPAAVDGAMATQGKKHDGPCWRNSHADCGC